VNPQARLRQHATNPPTRMREDVKAHHPFAAHFSMHLLMSCRTQTVTDRMEAFYIQQCQATGPQGYNVLKGAPRTCPALHARLAAGTKSHRKATAHSI
jgi:hypothetical protein